MRQLLDTHVLIWFLEGNTQQLPKHTRDVICSDENVNYVSVASLLEVAVKSSIGKLELKTTFPQFVKLIDDNGFILLPITADDAFVLSTLKFHHKDPFDRIMVAQCLANNLSIVTRDNVFSAYGISIVW